MQYLSEFNSFLVTTSTFCKCVSTISKSKLLGNLYLIHFFISKMYIYLLYFDYIDLFPFEDCYDLMRKIQIHEDLFY